MKQIFICVLIIVLLIFSVYSKQPDWFFKLQKIKVFQSDKQDVRKVFGNLKVLYSTSENPKETGWGETIEYQTDEGKLEVYYSTGRCSELTNKKGWDIDEEIVVSIEFEPNKPIDLPELNLNLDTFTGYKESDTQYYNYRSSELGIEFTLLEGKLTSIEYSLTPEMKKFDCEVLLKDKLK